MIGEGKSVQLLLTARLSVKQWDLWEGGLGIRGRCHRLLRITFMKASPPSLSLSSTQEFTAPAVLLPATRLSIEIPVSDRTGACCHG